MELELKNDGACSGIDDAVRATALVGWWWSGDEGGLTDSIFRGEDMEGVLGDLGMRCTLPDGALCLLVLLLLSPGKCSGVLSLPRGVGRSGVGGGIMKFAAADVNEGVAAPPAVLRPDRWLPLLPFAELCRCRSACWNPSEAPFWMGKAVGCPPPPIVVRGPWMAAALSALLADSSVEVSSLLLLLK